MWLIIYNLGWIAGYTMTKYDLGSFQWFTVGFLFVMAAGICNGLDKKTRS